MALIAIQDAPASLFIARSLPASFLSFHNLHASLVQNFRAIHNIV